MADVTEVFAQLLQNARQQAEARQLSWRSFADQKLASPAQFGDVDEEQQVAWWPVKRQTVADFSNVEHALELSLHPDIKAFFSHFYGGGVAMQHPRGPAELLMVWHDEDFARLQQNIIAHILMKRRLNQRETVFFAVTDDDDMLLSVLNTTGEVYLEQVGCEVKEKLADCLADFLQQLQPPVR